MNNMPFPYIPYPYPFPQYNNDKNDLIDEIVNLKKEIKNLEKKISALEKKENYDYTKKETGMYMM